MPRNGAMEIKKTLLIWILVSLLLVPSMFAIGFTATHNLALDTDAPDQTQWYGATIMSITGDGGIVNITKATGDGSTTVTIFNSSTIASAATFVGNGTFVGNTALISPPVPITNGTNFTILVHSNDAARTTYYNLEAMVGGTGNGYFKWWSSFTVNAADSSIEAQSNTPCLLSVGIVGEELPVIKFISQVPPDISDTNVMGGQLNLSYNISAIEGINESRVLVHYKVNNTVSEELVIVNGTALAPWQNKDGTNVSSVWTFLLDDNDIYPASYNAEPDLMNAQDHSSTALNTGSKYIKVEILNLTNNKPFNILEIMANTTGASPGRIYYCNATYITGDPSTVETCTNFFNIPAGQAYNHTHPDGKSSHHVIPFSFDNTTKLIGGVYVNEGTGQFLLRGDTGSPWRYYYIPNETRTSAIQSTLNAGTAWSDESLTVDAHIHQYSGNDIFHYFVEACDNIGNCTNSTLRSDSIDLGDLPPTAPDVFAPTGTGLSGIIPINWTESISPNQFDISHYNISLLNATFGFVSTIQSNNSVNLSFLWNTTTVADGSYIIRVEATDVNDKSSFGFSEEFSIKNILNINFTYPPLDDTITDINVFVNITAFSTGASIVNCTINNTLWSLDSNTSSIWSWLAANPPEGSYNVSATCNDTLGRNGTKTHAFTIDRSAPAIIQLSPAADNSSVFPNTGTINLGTTVTDNIALFLLEVNISAENGTKVFSTSISLSGTSFNFVNVSNTTTWDNTTYIETIRVCDAHTDSIIPIISNIVRYNNITFNHEGTDLNIEPLGSVIDSSIDRLTDRYTMQFEYIGISLSKEFLVRSESGIQYLPNSKHKGHFVIGNKLWVDFEQDAAVSVKKIDNNTYKVTIFTDKNTISLNSVGFLNCIVRDYSFQLVPVTVLPGYGIDLIEFTDWFNSDIFDTSTTPGVLLYMLLFVVLVACYVLSEVTRIPAVFTMTGLLTIAFGMLLFATISAIFGAFVVLFGALYIGRGFV